MTRPDCLRRDRKQLVGLIPTDRNAVIQEGAQLVAVGRGSDTPPVPMLGFVTSSYCSPALKSRICLALVKGGKERHGELVEAVAGSKVVPVRICDPVLYDREGARRDGG